MHRKTQPIFLRHKEKQTLGGEKKALKISYSWFTFFWNSYKNPREPDFIWWYLQFQKEDLKTYDSRFTGYFIGKGLPL